MGHTHSSFHILSLLYREHPDMSNRAFTQVIILKIKKNHVHYKFNCYITSVV